MEFIRNIYRDIRQRVLRFKVLKTRSFEVTKGSILIVAPHPDDETFGCAGLIVKKVEKNIDVFVAFLTNGENSLEAIRKEEIGQKRKKNAETVAKLLGVKEVYHLDFVDGEIVRRDNIEYKQSILKITKLINTLRPKEVYCTHPMDGWDDHIAASELMYDALSELQKNITLYYYWVWIWFSTPYNKVKFLNFCDTYYLPIQDVFENKEKAMQIYLDSKDKNGKPYCGKLPKLFLKAFNWPYEVFEKIDYRIASEKEKR